MDNTEIYGDHIEQHKNIKGHLDCSKLCKSDAECSFWTYFSGGCYLKDDDVFGAHNPSTVSGARNCSTSGNML